MYTCSNSINITKKILNIEHINNINFFYEKDENVN